MLERRAAHHSGYPMLITALLKCYQTGSHQGVSRKNMLVMVRVIHLTLAVVKELPSLRYIQASRTVRISVTKTLAAWRIDNVTSWQQNHTDETSRQHKSLVNLVMTVVQGDGTS